MVVARKQSADPLVYNLGIVPGLNKAIRGLERILGLQALLNLTWLALPVTAFYQSADAVHLHLIQGGDFSLLGLPLLTYLRPTVWTLHDPWVMTGHCVHPFGCERWLTGCGACPDLTITYPLWYDTTALLWRIKRWIFVHSDLTLVVASQWMREHVARSPLLAHLPCHLIPFGVDLQVFSPQDQATCRARLGIPPQARVLAFRAGRPEDRFKGFPWLLEALKLWDPPEPTYLLVLQGNGRAAELQGKYHVLDLGWVNDEARVVQALGAADLFVMPSLAESFGLMAVEALACGTPVVGFDGTAMTEIVRPPRGGILVPSKDSVALAQAIDHLLRDDELRARMGREGRQIAEQDYSLQGYLERHLALYESLVEKRKEVNQK
jgi:glycosyltransferase involved in cell wall biosynthesis